MAIKTILVHAHRRDAGSQDRLSVAVRIAARQQAHLRGLFITSEVSGAIEGRAASGILVSDMRCAQLKGSGARSNGSGEAPAEPSCPLRPIKKEKVRPSLL